jgi:adenine-specific DNA-methyltransferase
MSLRSDADQRTLKLSEPCILVQRTTAPEQSRRLVAAELDDRALAELGGAVVVENHVNVLRRDGQPELVGRGLLTRLLGTVTLDKLVRCISGSVALSAYELESLPLPDARTLASWEELSPAELEKHVAQTYLLTD